MDSRHELSVLVQIGKSARLRFRQRPEGTVCLGPIGLHRLHGRRNGLIEHSRSKVDVLLAIEALRFVLAINVDRKLQ